MSPASVRVRSVGLVQVRPDGKCVGEAAAEDGPSPVRDGLKYVLLLLRLSTCWPFQSTNDKLHQGWLLATGVIVVVGVAMFSYTSYICVNMLLLSGSTNSTGNFSAFVVMLALANMLVTTAQSPGQRVVILLKHRDISTFMQEWRQADEAWGRQHGETRQLMLRKFRRLGVIAPCVCAATFITYLVYNMYFLIRNPPVPAGDENHTSANASGDVYVHISAAAVGDANESVVLIVGTIAVFINVYIQTTQFAFFSYFLTLCQYLICMFDDINQRLRLTLTEGGDIHALSMEHLRMSRLVERCSDVFGSLLGFTHFTFILQILLICYTLATGVVQASYNFINFLFLDAIFNIANILACIYPANVTIQAHATEAVLYDYLTQAPDTICDKQKEHVWQLVNDIFSCWLFDRNAIFK